MSPQTDRSAHRHPTRGEGAPSRQTDEVARRTATPILGSGFVGRYFATVGDEPATPTQTADTDALRGDRLNQLAGDTSGVVPLYTTTDRILSNILLNLIEIEEHLTQMELRGSHRPAFVAALVTSSPSWSS